MSVTFGNVQNSLCTFFLHPNTIYFVHSIVLYIFIGVCKTLQPHISSMFEYAERVLYDSQEFFSVPKLQMPYLQAFSCFLQNPKPVLSLILSLDKTIGCRTFPPSDCLKMFKLLPEGIKNPCIFHSHGKTITGSG